MSEAYKVNEETSESEGQTIESISTEAVTTSTNAHNKKRELVSTEGEPSSSPSIIGNRIVSVSASSEGTKEESNKKLRLESKEMTDICSIVELKDGDRIEVHWDVQAPSGEPVTRWWGAILLPHDGRVTTLKDEEKEEGSTDSVSVPLRELLYDSYEEGGYPEKSKADVAFLSDHLVFDLGMQSTCCWRKIGSTWEPSAEDLTEATAEGTSPSDYSDEHKSNAVFFDGSRESMREIIDSVIARALVAVHSQFQKLTAAQQRYFATSVNEAKNKFVEQMMIECAESKEITPNHVRRCMEVVKRELDEAKARRGF